MMVEVPKDQYDKAVELMKNRILKGEVPGVTDPNAAYDIIRKGKLTYAQARNLAKAGTIESLTYDIATGAVNCSFAFGLSALVTFAFSFAQSRNPKQAAKEAAIAGLQTFGLSLGVQVLATQISRTGLQKALIPLSDIIIKNLGSKTTQTLINALRRLAGKKPIYGAAAQKSLSKALRANVIAQAISFVVFSIPDSINLARKKMSGEKYAKNITTLFVSFVGTALGGLGLAAALPKLVEKIGKNIPNPAVKVIVFVGGAAVGIAAGEINRKGFEIFREDDATIMNRMFNAAVINTCIEYMFNEKEVEEFLELLFKDDKSAKTLRVAMRKLYSSEEQYKLLQATMSIAAQKIAKKRPMLTKSDEPNEDELSDALAEVIKEVEVEEDGE